MNFYTTVWFFSVCICLILEGSQLGTYQQAMLNDLSVFTWWNIYGIFSVPMLNLYFFRGVYRLIIWDYSFYQGGYSFLRYFWAITLSPGMVWGIYQLFAPIASGVLSAIRGLLPW